METQQVQEQKLQFSGSGISEEGKEVTQWIFYGKEREKSIALMPNSIPCLAIIQSTLASL